jgi:hypothetical protein
MHEARSQTACLSSHGWVEQRKHHDAALVCCYAEWSGGGHVNSDVDTE